jgi:hypothetical protein
VPVDKLLERLPHPRVLASIHDLLHRCLFKSIGEDTFRLDVLGFFDKEMFLVISLTLQYLLKVPGN